LGYAYERRGVGVRAPRTKSGEKKKWREEKPAAFGRKGKKKSAKKNEEVGGVRSVREKKSSGAKRNRTNQATGSGRGQVKQWALLRKLGKKNMRRGDLSIHYT